MSAAGKAGIAYFAGMFALGFILGTIRVLWVAPVLGAWSATLLELPVMLAASWFYCRWLLRRFPVPRDLDTRLLMGAIAFALLMTAELALGIGLFERSLARQIAEMTSGPGLAGLAGQVVFASFPVFQRLRHARS